MGRNDVHAAVVAVLICLALPCGVRCQDQKPHQKRSEQPDYQLYQNGYMKVVAGEFAEAGKVFDEFASKYPQSAYADDALFWKAYSIAAQEQYPAAVNVYQSVVDKYPASNYADDALFRIAEICETKMNDYDKAIAKYEELIAKYPESPLRAEAGLYNARSQMQGKNDYGKAIESFKLAQDEVNRRNTINPEQTWVWKTADRSLKFLQENKDHDWVPVTLFFKAQQLKAAGDSKAALEKFRSILKQYPDARICDDVELEIADCLAKAGDLEGAAAQLKAFKEKYRDSSLMEKAENDAAAVEKKHAEMKDLPAKK